MFNSNESFTRIYWIKTPNILLCLILFCSSCLFVISSFFCYYYSLCSLCVSIDITCRRFFLYTFSCLGISVFVILWLLVSYVMNFLKMGYSSFRTKLSTKLIIWNQQNQTSCVHAQTYEHWQRCMGCVLRKRL